MVYNPSAKGLAKARREKASIKFTLDYRYTRLLQQMQFKLFAIAAIASQAAATLDVLTNSQISERLFGLSTEQVKNIDRAVHEATTPIVQVASQIVRSMRPTFEEALADSQKIVREAAQVVNQAFTPDVRAKIRTSVMNAVKTTLDSHI
ncbi:hypothetical protein DL89DRAFT_254278 [Linderina pennispora]|uniref:Uncharacterized protein n=1 Tax=Linderina pennispora TaxID=61395 RepID=A0A1Y1WM44_9FUNG|nr:uncharacterized protein DL89DRAFT_254278 [Linderina pennispora]ORX74435.1 hypothetical protein DL89DRAFT_254278 [Linderina pennispora]